MNDRTRRATAEARREETATAARLTVYLASAPGAGKTRRLLDDALRLQQSGIRVVLGSIATKGRRDLEEMATHIARGAPRIASIDGVAYEDFDFEATLEAKPQVVVLDELAHANLPDGVHRKRWQDALALRAAGIGVVGALDIAHLETVAPTAEELIGEPVTEIVPVSFLREADHVIALDVAPEQLQARRVTDMYPPQALRTLREIMLRTIDDLETPDVTPQRASRALALATGEGETRLFLQKSASLAQALDLALDIALVGERDIDALAAVSHELEAHVVPLEHFDAMKPHLSALKATLVSVPYGELAHRIAGRPAERDAFVVDAATYGPPVQPDITFPRYAQTVGDRLRIGYGRLTIYLAAGPGSGKTYAMLDRAHQLLENGVDVVVAFVDTHGRAETAAKLQGVPVLARRELGLDGERHGELDLPVLLARRPAVALIDELARDNAAGAVNPKRYDAVLQALRAGVSVMTTLDVQHLEGLSDAVHRITGERVVETVPDDVLKLADDVILIDTTADTLRRRLRAGTIYGADKIDDALHHAFRSETLTALRELALREVVRARGDKRASPFTRLMLGVKARARDTELIERCARIASRLEIDLWVVHVMRRGEAPPSGIIEELATTARRVRARWSVTTGTDVAQELMDTVGREGAGTLAIEGARRRPVWPRGVPFARRLLDAGAKQLLILAPPP
ncbi:MAG: hypothetical protein GIX03_07720 [Candidatus Eremiobacteraeota bacterium]|nr:hypothetical protein [Candidatus Eremiobacteraeota bacterium]MBC5802876.1 hypothetical protein [Candidatus Eremiobacteraeota bacterium]MBC5821923.1 hypothetical protein [Candidatus Eremiobacteraeota bacterium]